LSLRPAAGVAGFASASRRSSHLRVTVLLVMWGLCYWLYRRKIFFKL
jgi:hypothetical protein